MQFWNYRLPFGTFLQLAPPGRNRTLVVDWETLKRQYVANEVLNAVSPARKWEASYGEVMSELRYRERIAGPRNRRRLRSLNALRRTIEELYAPRDDDLVVPVSN